MIFMILMLLALWIEMKMWQQSSSKLRFEYSHYKQQVHYSGPLPLSSGVKKRLGGDHHYRSLKRIFSVIPKFTEFHLPCPTKRN